MNPKKEDFIEKSKQRIEIAQRLGSASNIYVVDPWQTTIDSLYFSLINFNIVIKDC
jgi:hypothetical protein